MGLSRKSHIEINIPFQSTHSVGSGTKGYDVWASSQGISIHPLRGEWDFPIGYIVLVYSEFQSTHSVGSGTRPVTRHGGLPTFQSTHSVGSGTLAAQAATRAAAISIHPLRGEWDFWEVRRRYAAVYFNPPTPWGVGPKNPARSCLKSFPFQSTHSVGSGTFRAAFRQHRRRKFQSTHSVGSGTAKLHKKICNFYTKQTMLPIRFAFCVRMIAKRARILFICSRFFARTSPVFYVHLWFASDSQKAFRFIRLFRSVMLNLCLIVIPEIIKSQAIFVFIHDRKKFML